MKHELNTIENQLLSLAKFRVKGFEFGSNATDDAYKAVIEKLRVQHELSSPNRNRYLYKELCLMIVNIIRLVNGERSSTIDMILFHQTMHSDSMEKLLNEEFYYSLFRELLVKLSNTPVKELDYNPVDEI